MTECDDVDDLDAELEARIDALDLDDADAEAIRRSVRIREQYTLEPEFTVEVPEAVADYVREAAARNEAGADDSEYLREGLSHPERVENLLIDFLNVRPRWVFPDGTVIERGEVVDDGDE